MASLPSRTPTTPLPAVRTPAPALPLESHPAWASLIKGSLRHDFAYAAAGVLVFNLNLQWKRDPSRLPQLIEQARAFFQRYQHLLGQDIARLFA